MSKHRKISLADAQISSEELSAYGEVISIINTQDRLTDRLLKIDEKITDIRGKDFDGKLLLAMETRLVELLDTLGKAYYTRNGDESEARALKDLHALKFRQEAINSEGKSALKQDAFFSGEEEKVHDVLEQTAEREAALEAERKALSRMPFFDHGKKLELERQIKEIGQQYENLLKDLFDSTKEKKIGKMLEEEYHGRKEQRAKIAQSIKLLSQNVDYADLEKKIEELAFLADAYHRIAETLADSESQDFQKNSARACLLELRSYLSEKKDGSNSENSMRKAYQALESSLDFEKQREDLETRIGEITLKLEQKMIQAKSQTNAILNLRSKILSAESQSDQPNQLAALNESFGRLALEYEKVGEILQSVLKDCETKGQDPSVIIGLITELGGENLETIYLQQFFKELAQFEELLNEIRHGKERKSLPAPTQLSLKAPEAKPTINTREFSREAPERTPEQQELLERLLSQTEGAAVVWTEKFPLENAPSQAELVQGAERWLKSVPAAVMQGFIELCPESAQLIVLPRKITAPQLLEVIDRNKTIPDQTDSKIWWKEGWNKVAANNWGFAITDGRADLDFDPGIYYINPEAPEKQRKSRTNQQIIAEYKQRFTERGLDIMPQYGYIPAAANRLAEGKVLDQENWTGFEKPSGAAFLPGARWNYGRFDLNFDDLDGCGGNLRCRPWFEGEM